MSNEIGQLVVKMAADMARFEQDMRRSNRIANDTMRQMSTDVNRGVAVIQGSLRGVGTAIVASFSVGSIIAFTQEMGRAGLAAEKLQMQFKASAGAERAGKELEYVRNLANKLGLDFQSTATAYSKWIASTRNSSIEGQQAQRVFEGFSKGIIALGLSAEESSGIFLALSQMMNKTKISAEEMNQINERFPGLVKLMADAMGLLPQQLLKQMELGKVLSSQVLPQLADQIDKTYGKAAEEAAKKGQAGINRFKNEVTLTAQEIGGVLMPAINAAANGMASLLKTMRNTSSTKFINDEFALPEDAGFVERNRARLGVDVDPQMARLEADRRSKQEAINAQRKKEEEWAAGAADREKKANEAAKKAKEEQTEAQRKLNAELKMQNALLEESVKGWSFTGMDGAGLLDNSLQWQPSAPVFSLTGRDSSGFAQNLPEPEEIKATAEELAAFNMEVADYQRQLYDRTAIGGAINGLAVYVDAAQNAGAAVENAVVNSFLSMEDALVEFTMTGKASFSDMANSIIADMIRIAYRKAIIGPLAEGLGNAIGGAFGSYDMGVPNVGPQLPGRASGGPVTGGATYLVGERGPELFTPNVSGAIIPNHRLSRAGGGVTVNVINPPGERNEVESQSTRFDGQQMIVDLVLKKMRSDPATRAAFANGGSF